METPCFSLSCSQQPDRSPLCRRTKRLAMYRETRPAAVAWTPAPRCMASSLLPGVPSLRSWSTTKAGASRVTHPQYGNFALCPVPEALGEQNRQVLISLPNGYGRRAGLAGPVLSSRLSMGDNLDLAKDIRRQDRSAIFRRIDLTTATLMLSRIVIRYASECPH